MPYDPEKYREKREKVLGIKKRGMGFGTIAAIVSAVIILGLGVVTVPQAVSYMAARNLDDAIFKLDSKGASPDMVLKGIEGIQSVVRDKNGARLVVTYDRRIINVSSITARFSSRGIDVTLLNQVSHLQHQATLESEEENL